jgi:hypothetical protein
MDRMRRRFRKDESGTSCDRIRLCGRAVPVSSACDLRNRPEFPDRVFAAKRDHECSPPDPDRPGAEWRRISAADFKTELCKNVPSYLDCASKVMINVETRTDFSATTRTSASDGNGNLSNDLQNSPSWDPGNPGDVVIVETFYEWELFTPFINYILECQRNAEFTKLPVEQRRQQAPDNRRCSVHE